MPLIVSATGTYDWRYWYSQIGYHGVYSTVPQYQLDYMNTGYPFGEETLELAAAQIIDHLQYVGSGTTEVILDEFVPLSTAPVSPYVSGTVGPFFVQTGATYDTGVVQIYAYGVDVSFIEAYDETQNRSRVYRNYVWIYYAPSGGGTPATPPAPGAYPTVPVPDPVTLQLKLNVGAFYPNDSTILPKYNSGQQTIRATYDSGTKTGVITQAVDGGFLIYREIAGVPSGNVYVYTNERKLKAIVDASQIGQYLL